MQYNTEVNKLFPAGVVILVGSKEEKEQDDIQKLLYKMGWLASNLRNNKTLDWVIFGFCTPIGVKTVELDENTTHVGNTQIPEYEQESEKGQGLFFNHFCCFLISIKLQQSFTPKPCFISQT